MGFMFDILSYSISSIFWGLLMAGLYLFLFFFLIKGWYRNATFNGATVIVGMILGVLLAFQCILVCGAIKLISITDDFVAQATMLVNTLGMNSNDIVSTQTAGEVLKELIDSNPLLAEYIGSGRFVNHTVESLPQAMGDELISYMHWYIFRRAMWCLLFTVVGAIIVIKTMSKKMEYGRSYPSSTDYRRTVSSSRRMPGGGISGRRLR